MLDTNGHDGIVGSDEDINRRQEVFGKNSVVLPSITPFLDLYAQQFEDSNIVLLIIAAAVYLAFSFFGSQTIETMKDGTVQAAPESSYIETLTIYVGVVFATSIAAAADYV
jgi:hypothetical protein